MNLSTYAAAALLPALLLAPLTVSAQTSNWWHNYDGYAQSTTSYQGGHYGQQLSSAVQAQVAALDAMATSSIAMPVLFGVKVSNLTPNFGDPRDGGTRTHQGEDIMAVSGTPVVSPTLAVVLKAETGASEGNAVYTINPGGEIFVYMHLDRFGEGVAAGNTLQPGALVGYVGNTGDAAGGPAHLHFEVRTNTGTPTDPFVRLTIELPLQQKITDLTTILSQTSSSTQLAALLVTNFRSDFTAAQASGIALPQQIINALASVAVTYSTPTASAISLPAGELEVGSSGAAVVTLQTYLISSNMGPASVRLAQAGATGTFGPLTASALAEFQAMVGIVPASGYYGPLTRAYVAAHPAGSAVAVVASGQSNTPPSAVGSGTSAVVSGTVTRDLKLGSTGTDVQTLQQKLNSTGFTVAASGAGSVGQESTYFGLATQAAVIAYQKAHSITPAAGYVGPLTRAALVL